MRRAAEMVFGSLPDVRHVCLSEDKGIAQFEAELSAVFEELPGGEPVAVLCDVNGGSPYNTSLRLLEQMGRLETASVVSGMDLPLLLVLLMAEDSGRETVKAVSYTHLIPMPAQRRAVNARRLNRDQDGSS